MVAEDGNTTQGEGQRKGKTIYGLSFFIMEISNSDIDKAINEWIHNKRNREILHERLIDGIKFEELAEKHDLSPQQVKNIVRKGKEIVFKHVKEKI